MPEVENKGKVRAEQEPSRTVDNNSVKNEVSIRLQRGVGGILGVCHGCINVGIFKVFLLILFFSLKNFYFAGSRK